MGLFDLLSKEGRAKSARTRHIARVSSKYAQSADRFASMEALRKDGSEEALVGLLRRFSFKYDKSIEDEQEKNWVVQTMVAKGEAAIGAVRRYAATADSLSGAVLIFEDIVPGDKLLEIIDELLVREEPGYPRDPGRKIELMTFLADWKVKPASELAPRILPYVKDFDQNVRFQAIAALGHQPDEASSRLPLLDAIVRPEEEAKRIKTQAAEILAKQGWKVTEKKAELEALLGGDLAGYTLKNDVLVEKGK